MSVKNFYYNRCKSNRYSEQALIDEYYRAKNGGTVRQLLYGEETDLPPYKGIYQEGDHFRNGLKCGFGRTDRDSTKNDEKRIIKCMSFRANGYNECFGCLMENEPTILAGDYRIIDYELPFTSFDGLSRSRIDLILQKDNMKYATEVKPPVGNDERLIRMVAEIITYTYGLPDSRYKKAIGIFEGSAQDEYYKNISPELAEMIKEEKITVFRFERAELNDKTYVIRKLNDLSWNE